MSTLEKIVVAVVIALLTISATYPAASLKVEDANNAKKCEPDGRTGPTSNTFKG